MLFDGSYELVDESKLNLKPVKLTGGDCDDRSWVMMSQTLRAYIMMGDVIEKHPNYLFGFVEGYDSRRLKHAWCFFINREGEVRYVEPSTADIFSPSIERVYHFIR